MAKTTKTPKTKKKLDFTVKDKPRFVQLLNFLREAFPEGSKFTNESVKSFYNLLQEAIEEVGPDKAMADVLSNLIQFEYNLRTVAGESKNFQIKYVQTDNIGENCGTGVMYNYTEHAFESHTGGMAIMLWLLRELDVKGIVAFSHVEGHESVEEDFVMGLPFTDGCKINLMPSYNSNTGNTIVLVCISMPNEEEDEDLIDQEVDPDGD
jgi:hypothetical protein